MSLRKCIDQMCKSCIYDNHAPGNWRQQVEACSVTKCPLYGVRPITTTTMKAMAGRKDPARSAAMKARWSDPSYRERIKTAKEGASA